MANKEEILDIEIDWDTCQITAHLEGSDDPATCKKDIMKMLEGLGDFTDFAFTMEFKDRPSDPNAKQRTGPSRSRQRETN
jgi:hypothetical protein